MTSLLKPFQPFLRSGDFSDIYLEDSRSLSLTWEDGRIEEVNASEDSGIGLRILNGFETRYGHMNMAWPDSSSPGPDEKSRLESIFKQLSSGLPASSLPSPAPPRQFSHGIVRNPDAISLEEKMALLKRAFKATQIDASICQVKITYGEKTKRTGYLNSEGESYLEDRVYMVMSLSVMVEKNGDRQKAYEAMGGLAGYEFFDGDMPERLGKLVAARALKKIEAPQAPVGEMPVVLAASAGGTMIHEAVGHSLEADAVMEGTSPSFAGKMGKIVGNEKLTVMDDPTLAGRRGSFHMDDEGTPSESTILIENGVLKNYLYDRLSAKRAGKASNGHGRRQSYAHRPIPRMSNTFVAPGKDNPEEIVQSLQNGFLVTKMGGGQVNTANGDFVFDVEEGFQVKDGQKTFVRGATLLGNGPDVLMNIDQVGSDHGWSVGTCGKEGQGVPVSDAIPTLRVRKLVVGGR